MPKNKHDLRIRISEGYGGFEEEAIKLGEKRCALWRNLRLVRLYYQRRKLPLVLYDPYSLENNMITMEILEAAVQSSKIERTVKLKK